MAMLQDMKAMKPEKMDDPNEVEMELWDLRKSSRIDIPCSDLEHIKTVVVRELIELADRLAKTCRDDQERVAIRLSRCARYIRFANASVKLLNRGHTKSSDSG